jgi:putative chitinase
MFPDDVGDTATVQAGLPSLFEEMVKAEITTPRRVAAFLTSVAHECGFEYNLKQRGATGTWAGRGDIQLTGKPNYFDAGAYLGVDLVSSPDLVLTLAWSAKTATWYWTKARPKCNLYADTLQFGKICAAIGYPLGDGSEDLRRTASFESALKHLTGAVPAGISSAR